MNREIKFRAWSKYHKEMILVEELDFGANTWNKTAACYSNNKYRCLFYGVGGNGILMQCTGLHDKNGKDLYEGDLVTCDGFGGTYEVVYEGCSFQGKHLESDNGGSVDLEMQTLTIVGNKYEN